jgi:hypothetical protein
MSHASPRPYARAEDLAVVVCHYNPHGYASRRENLGAFLEPFSEWDDAFSLVECALEGATFESPRASMSVRAADALWQKERLLSLAIERLPARFTKVAWLDADVLFTDHEWAPRTSRALDERPILQPFSRVVRLARGARTETRGSEAWESFAAVHARRPELHLLDRGLYDRCLSGAADHVIAHALSGDFRSACVLRTFGKERAFVEHFERWARPLHDRVRGRIGVVEGDLFHLWHGELAHRHHTRRSRELVALGYDPARDVHVNGDGVLALSEGATSLRGWSRDFFGARREDGE